jgi:hypothetical protein
MTTTDRAAHEAGHAVMCFLLGVPLRGATAVGGDPRTEYIPGAQKFGGPASMAWLFRAMSEGMVALAGGFAEHEHGADAREDVTDETANQIAVTAHASTAYGVAARAADVIERAWEDLDEPEAILDPRYSDRELAERLVAGVVASPAEAATLIRFMELRTMAVVRTDLFAALHAHITNLLRAHGQLDGNELKVECQRIILRLSRSLQADDDEPEE